MKKFIFALAFVFAPCAVHAGRILPNLYAEKFCQYAALGVSLDDARKAAIDAAYISSGKPTQINYKGKMINSDIIDAAIAVSKRCPQYMK